VRQDFRRLDNHHNQIKLRQINNLGLVNRYRGKLAVQWVIF
jgi:hypothetical protein